ncbi:MAG: DUF6029 family protein [Bacteroidota bacterium]|nr:DUF6029 family protein [Bacteroidota bacterium]
MIKLILRFLPLLSMCVSLQLTAQEGRITGNFQGDFQYYISDTTINAVSPDERLLMNSYANFTYHKGNFSAGLRYEGYLNTLAGFPGEDGRNDGVGIPHRWARFSKNGLEITAGNFYEQFGNGLSLRTYEEKNLGIDNSLDGVRVKYNPVFGLNITGLVGKQRYYFDYGPGIVRGFDAEIGINDVISPLMDKMLRIRLGGSFVSKYQDDNDPMYVLPENVATTAARINVNYKLFNLETEYAYKINDPSQNNNYIYKPGQAFLATSTYSQSGLGILVSTKWVDNMSFRSDRNAVLTDLNINHLPEITKNHTYTLAAYYPYATQPTGEWGMQAEVFYKFKRKTTLGGKYGTQIALNYARVHNIDKNQVNDTTPLNAMGTDGYKTQFFSVGEELYFEDINLEVSKKWTKQFKSVLTYQHLTLDNNILLQSEYHGMIKAHIGIADLTYKLNSDYAIRTEFQGMFTDQDKGNWALGLIEINAPNVFFTIMDNWNYGNPEKDQRIHYFTLGMGYVKGGNRIQLSYGKQRQGVMCVGGVCRMVPASNGVMLSISSTF